jgi:hypothetical protein
MEPVSLSGLRQQIIHQIYLVDYEDDPETDLYSPWQVILVFEQGDQLLVVEDAYDGEHITLELSPRSQLESILTEATAPTLWKPYPTGATDALAPLLGGQLTQLLVAREKPEYRLNGKLYQGNPSCYSGLKLSCEHHGLTLFNNGVGLFVGLDSLLMPPFEQANEWFEISDCH